MESLSRPAYLVHRWADVERVLRDSETFSSSINGEHMGQFMGELILAMDGAGAPRVPQPRGQGVPGVARSSGGTPSSCGPPIDGLLDGIAPLGRADLVVDLTSKYPVQVICGIVGVPLEDQRAVPPVGRGDQHRSARTRAGHARVAGDARLPRRRSSRTAAASRRDDLISDLVHAEVDGERLTDEQDLRLPAPAAARGRGDDVPRDGQRAARAADASRRAATRRRRPRARAGGDRGDAALGDVGDDGEPRRRGHRHRDRRRARSRRARRSASITGSANHDETRFDDADEWTSAGPPSTTSRSAPARTSASACTSPGSSSASGSTRSSTGCRTCASTPTRPRPSSRGTAFRGRRHAPGAVRRDVTARVLVTRRLPDGGLDPSRPATSSCSATTTSRSPPTSWWRRCRDVDAIVCHLTDRIDARRDRGGRRPASGRRQRGRRATTTSTSPPQHELGVAVCNTPGVLDETTADLAFAPDPRRVAGRASEAERDLRAGRWTGLGHRPVPRASTCTAPRSVSSATAASAGPSPAAPRGSACEVLHHARTRHRRSPGACADLDELLRRSPTSVSLHVPLSARDPSPDRRPPAGADEADRGAREHRARARWSTRRRWPSRSRTGTIFAAGHRRLRARARGAPAAARGAPHGAAPPHRQRHRRDPHAHGAGRGRGGARGAGRRAAGEPGDGVIAAR